jgi:protein TonB
VRTAWVRLSAYVRDMSLRRRVAGIVAALAINALLLLMLLTLAPYTPGRKTDDGSLMTFSVTPDAPRAASKPAVQQAVRSQAHAAPPPIPPPVLITPPSDLGLIHMSRDELAQVDTAMRAPPVSRAGRDSAPEEAMGSGSDTPTASGKGPNGETLYRAAWYREPTQAELSTYIPNARPGSYGVIACRTVARFHVDDCVAMEESPAGSGMSRGVLNAAWQFLVLPPRIGGHTMVGSWVKIMIHITDAPSSKADRPEGR